ncbi:MAG: hypothetical protein P4M15_02825, partial [Alphaproteobacteria bacterium]|nr:hypothetical protein [Alphaproteobacteria bacterium]
MRFFGKLNGLKAAQAAAKMPPLMHPGNVPATMKQFPADFHGYQFVGATTDMISIRGANEVVTRRPALVALLKYESISADGASSLIEMTASLRDLSNARHPDASKIGDSLRTYYETKVYGGEREAAPNEQFALPKAA